MDATYDRLIRNELRYILDPKEVRGDDPSTGLREGFPGETFRVLKEKEVKQFGDAPRRTRRLAEGGGVGRAAPRQYPQNEGGTKIGADVFRWFGGGTVVCAGNDNITIESMRGSALTLVAEHP